LTSLSAKNLELNELGWWGNWADVKWFGDNSWVLLSRRFDEYFLNRAGFLGCREDGGTIGQIEKLFAERKRAPHFFVQEACSKLLRNMESAGYRGMDSMSVMTLENAKFSRMQEAKVAPAGGGDLTKWSEVYLKSFYGGLGLMRAVTEIVESLHGIDEVTLLTGELGGKPAGTMALYRTPALLGAYCVGTLPRFRGRGVATSLLETAHGIARSEGRRLVLQSILSDGYEGFYKNLGFERLYLKTLLRKKQGVRPRSRRSG
jgi:GNAT superfamily N-acetyltransferase